MIRAAAAPADLLACREQPAAEGTRPATTLATISTIKALALGASFFARVVERQLRE